MRHRNLARELDRARELFADSPAGYYVSPWEPFTSSLATPMRVRWQECRNAASQVAILSGVSREEWRATAGKRTAACVTSNRRRAYASWNEAQLVERAVSKAIARRTKR